MIKKENNYIPDVYFTRVDHQQQIEQIEETRISNINIITTTQKIFRIRRLV